MCIVCNTDDPAQRPENAGLDFLTDFELARLAMQKATDSMLRCSKRALDEKHRRGYDRAHKRMVVLVRDWNRIEHSREVPCPRPARSPFESP